MPTTTDQGVVVPVGSDPFAPQPDMDSLARSLAGRIVVPVPNEAARAALASTSSPSDAAPLFVWRQDAVAGRKLEVTTNGTNWDVYDTRTASGTANLNGTHWDSGDVSWSRWGPVRTVRINARRAFTGGAATDIPVINTNGLPAAMRPAAEVHAPVGWTLGSYAGITCRLMPDGSANLWTSPRGQSITQGHFFRVTITWVEPA